MQAIANRDVDTVAEQVRFTPFKYSTIPPPMGHVEITSPYNVIDVAISQSGSRLSVLTLKDVLIYEWLARNKRKRAQTPTLVRSFTLDDARQNASAGQQVLFISDSTVLVLRTGFKTSNILEFDVDSGSRTYYTHLKGRTRMMATSVEGDLAIAQSHVGYDIISGPGQREELRAEDDSFRFVAGTQNVRRVEITQRGDPAAVNMALLQIPCK